MDEQIQPQPQPQPAAGQNPPVAPAKKSNIWVWILGGCLAVVLLIGIVIVGLGWWGAKKVKKAIKENQPKLEEMQKDAEKWQQDSEELQKAADEWQKEMEKIKDQMPASE